MEFSQETSETSEGRMEILKTLDCLYDHFVKADEELHDACFVAQSINRCEPELAQAVFDAYSALKEARDWIDCTISGVAETEYREKSPQAQRELIRDRLD